jgi:hypothetical protein
MGRVTQQNAFASTSQLMGGVSAWGWYRLANKRNVIVCISQQSDPSAYFKDVIRFLQAPGVADYFVPSDEFVTSQQYRNPLASL